MGVGVKSARVTCNVPAAAAGTTAYTAFTWPEVFADDLHACTITAFADSGTVALAAAGQTAPGFTIRGTNTGAARPPR